MVCVLSSLKSVKSAKMESTLTYSHPCGAWRLLYIYIQTAKNSVCVRRGVHVGYKKEEL